MIDSPEQYKSITELLSLLDSLSLKTVDKVWTECIDMHDDEYGECEGYCGYPPNYCECERYDDYDYDYERDDDERETKDGAEGSESTDSENSSTDGSNATSSETKSS
jgi:hypothetical protein